MENDIYIHVGYPKTATTTLQANIFSEHSQIEYIPDALHVDGTSKKPDIIEEADEDDRTVIISNERLLEPRFDFENNPRRLDENPSLANKNVKILFTIRSQLSLIKSAFTFWNGYFRREGYDNVNNMIKKEIREKSRKTSLREWLSYNTVVGGYEKHFGRDKIEILKYEELKNSPELFVRKLSEILMITQKECNNLLKKGTSRNVQPKSDTHKKPSRLYWALSVFKSSFLPNSPPLEDIPLGGYVKHVLSRANKSVYLNEESVHILKNIYGKGNEKLFDNYDLEKRSEYVFE